VSKNLGLCHVAAGALRSRQGRSGRLLVPLVKETVGRRTRPIGIMGDLVFFMTGELTTESRSATSNGAARPPLLLELGHGVLDHVHRIHPRLFTCWNSYSVSSCFSFTKIVERIYPCLVNKSLVRLELTTLSKPYRSRTKRRTTTVKPVLWSTREYQGARYIKKNE
jgi:hypothetical protein